MEKSPKDTSTSEKIDSINCISSSNDTADDQLIVNTLTHIFNPLVESVVSKLSLPLEINHSSIESGEEPEIRSYAEDFKINEFVTTPVLPPGRKVLTQYLRSRQYGLKGETDIFVPFEEYGLDFARSTIEAARSLRH